MQPGRGDVTCLLQTWKGGDRGALDGLIPLLERELHKIAKHYMAAQPLHHTLQTTAWVASPEPDADIVAIDEALSALARLYPRKARVIELRFFGGLSLQETAAVLEVSEDTVRRDWKMGRAWLARELKRGTPHGRGATAEG